MSHLSTEQRASYANDQSFEVVGSAGNRYRINRGADHNVTYFSTNGRYSELCAVPQDVHLLPYPLVALAQMLALVTDEPGFLQVANICGPTPVINIA